MKDPLWGLYSDAPMVVDLVAKRAEYMVALKVVD